MDSLTDLESMREYAEEQEGQLFTFDRVVREEKSGGKAKGFSEEVREMCSSLFKSTLLETEEAMQKGVCLLNMGLSEKEALFRSDHSLLSKIVSELFTLGESFTQSD